MPAIPVMNSSIRRNEVQVRSNLKSLVFVVVGALITTLNALLFRLYLWLSPVEMFLIGQLATFCFNLPPWVHSSRFTKQTCTTLKNRTIYLHLGFHCVIVAVAAFLHFQSLKLLSSSLVFIITSLGPFFSLVLSRIIFKENITVIKVIALLLTILSVVLTTLIGKSLSITGTSTQFVTGLALSVTSCLVGSVTNISFKNLSSWNVTLVCLIQAGFATIVCLVILFSTGTFVVPQCGVTGLVLLGGGLGSALNLALHFYAYKFGEAGKVSTMMKGCQIVFSLVWDVLFFGLNPRFLQYISALLAIIGTGLNGFDQYLSYPKCLSKAICKSNSHC